MALFKAFLRYLPFIALVFLGLYAYRLDPELARVRISAWSDLVAATVLMVGVFFIRAWMWYRLLAKSGVRVTFRQAMVSRFKPILTKYVPGKVWTVLATAQAVSEAGTSFRGSFFLSTWFQVCLIITGLLLGGAGIAVLGLPLPGTTVAPGIALSVVALIAILLAPRAVSQWLLGWLQRRGYIPGDVRAPPGGEALVVGVGQWALTGLAFAWLMRALGIDAGLWPVFFQPLANALGTVSVLTPGGLAVREGVMVAYLGLAGVDPRAALVAALAARVWFMLVELVVFLLGLLAERLPGRRPG